MTLDKKRGLVRLLVEGAAGGGGLVPPSRGSLQRRQRKGWGDPSGQTPVLPPIPAMTERCIQLRCHPRFTSP